MKKIKILIGILVVIFLVTSIVYAGINVNKTIQQDSFFVIDNTQISQNEIMIMTIDISKIKYDNFIFTLSSGINVQEINTQDVKNNETNIDTENNQLKIEVNKDELSVNEIKLYYTIPETVAIGSKIAFKAIVTSNENKEENNNVNNINEKQTVEITVNVIAKKQENVIENSIDNKIIQDNTFQDSNIKKDNNKTSQTSSSTSKSIGTTQTQETVIYNGSADNYLTSISIDDYDITPEFNKTNQTYFVSIPHDITNISINTVKSSATANVKVYGNTNLKVGENKVLISVTAENGNVRTYRIYVTREE